MAPSNVGDVREEPIETAMVNAMVNACGLCTLTLSNLNNSVALR
jgi:hypothetical protein